MVWGEETGVNNSLMHCVQLFIWFLSYFLLKKRLIIVKKLGNNFLKIKLKHKSKMTHNNYEASNEINLFQFLLTSQLLMHQITVMDIVEAF